MLAEGEEEWWPMEHLLKINLTLLTIAINNKHILHEFMADNKLFSLFVNFLWRTSNIF